MLTDFMECLSLETLHRDSKDKMLANNDYGQPSEAIDSLWG